jgi:ribonuclease HI
MDKHVSICSDCQAALKTLQAVRTSQLVQQCQTALNISALHTVGLYWVAGRAGLRGNEIVDELARGGSAIKNFLGLSRSWESVGRR